MPELKPFCFVDRQSTPTVAILVCLIQSCGPKNRKNSESTIDRDMKI